MRKQSSADFTSPTHGGSSLQDVVPSLVLANLVTWCACLCFFFANVLTSLCMCMTGETASFLPSSG